MHVPDFVQEWKTQAENQFTSLPSPTEKQEQWRHTAVDKIDIDLKPSSNPTIIFEKGTKQVGKEGIIVTRMDHALIDHADFFDMYGNPSYLLDNKDPLQQLNFARFTDGYFIWVPENTEVSEKIELMIDAKEVNVMHNLIIVGKNSKVDIVEKVSSASPTKLNSLTRVLCQDNSKTSLTHLNWHHENSESIVNGICKLEKDASLDLFTTSFGGKLNRVKWDTHFDGEGAHATNNGVYVGNAHEHIDVTTNAHHHVPHTKNDMNINGIMKGNSSSIYRGLIKIDHEAPHTNSFLSNHVLKLSESSIAHNIPALEIDTNDVAASHGATIGEVDEEQLFYLKSRGLTQEQAEDLIVHGFFEPIIEKVEQEGTREQVREFIHKHQ